MMARTGDDMPDIGFGERVERGKRRWYVWTIVTAGVVGGVTGGVLAVNGTGVLAVLNGTLSPIVAILLTLAYLLTIGASTWVWARHMDEHERSANLWAHAFGGSAFITVYPAWFLLWKGALVPEPSHGILFLLFLGVAMIGYLYKRSS